MPNTLFDFEKKKFAEVHIFVNGEDFEVIDCPIVKAVPNFKAVHERILYWKKIGFTDVCYQFVRVVEKLVVKEVKE